MGDEDAPPFDDNAGDLYSETRSGDPPPPDFDAGAGGDEWSAQAAGMEPYGADDQQQQQQWDGYDANAGDANGFVDPYAVGDGEAAYDGGGGDWDAPPAPDFEDPAALDAMFGDIEQQVNDFAY